MPRAGKAAALGLAAVLLLGLGGRAQAFDILLTNDDGYDAPGITAMQAALKKAGYDVTLIAPAVNQSGKSVALSFSGLTVVKRANKVYSVDATPASAVILGTSVILKGRTPDLIVSGINSGANIGPSTVISGTVGATIAGLVELNKPIPGVAISTDLVDPDATSAANAKHFADVAAFTARLVDRVTRNGTLRPPSIALNVNYPALAPAAVKGVRLAVQGQAALFPPSFAETAPGVYASTSRPVPPRQDVPDSDTLAFYRGYVTVVPIDADYTYRPNLSLGGLKRAGAEVTARLKADLARVKP